MSAIALCDGGRQGCRAGLSVLEMEVEPTEAATLLAVSRTVRAMSANEVLILSGPYFNQQHFDNQSTFTRESRGLRSLTGLIGIALALFLILFSSPACAIHLTLAWDPNDEPDLAGYIVYYGTASRNYKYDVDIGDQTSCTISGLNEDVMYYFAVTAYDNEGNESGYSQELSHTIPSPNNPPDSPAIPPDSPAIPPDSPAIPSGTGGGGGGGCFVTAASDNPVTSDPNNNLKNFAIIPLVISLLLAPLLPRCVPIPRARQQ